MLEFLQLPTSNNRKDLRFDVKDYLQDLILKQNNDYCLVKADYKISVTKDNDDIIDLLFF